MNLSTVIENIERTIRGKQMLLDGLGGRHDDPTINAINSIQAQFLEINIGELERIRDDLLVCREKEIADSWELNPERMGK